MAKITQKKTNSKSLDIAIIMDGNGRWALSNSLNVSRGHRQGVQVVREIVEESVKQKISFIIPIKVYQGTYLIERPIKTPHNRALLELFFSYFESKVPATNFCTKLGPP